MLDDRGHIDAHRVYVGVHPVEGVRQLSDKAVNKRVMVITHRLRLLVHQRGFFCDFFSPRLRLDDPAQDRAIRFIGQLVGVFLGRLQRFGRQHACGVDFLPDRFEVTLAHGMEFGVAAQPRDGFEGFQQPVVEV